MDKLKRAVIKEELVALTGNYVDAIILNQFIYWSERIKDFDTYQFEEKQIADRCDEEFIPNYSNGWIYKKAEQLSEETMLGLSPSNIRKHIQNLISKGFIIERNNPKYKWDKTKQYRVQLTVIKEKLNEIGYNLNDYRPLSSQNAETENNIAEKGELISKNENGFSKLENQNDCFRAAIPEITTENTIEKNIIHECPKDIHAAENFNDDFNAFMEEYFDLYERYFERTHPPLSVKQTNEIECRLEDFIYDVGIDYDTLIEMAKIYLENPGKTDGNIKCFAVSKNLQIYLARFYSSRTT